MKVAIVGAGHQGWQLALAAARAGHDTVLEDTLPANLRRSEDALLDAGFSVEVRARVQFALTVEDAVRDADLVIDLVPDELESKLEIFCMIDRMAPPRTVICTPTVAVSIADLATCTYRAAQCVSVRGVDAFPLVDARRIRMDRSTAASEATVDVAVAFWRSLGKAVEIGFDALEPGFAS